MRFLLFYFVLLAIGVNAQKTVLGPDYVGNVFAGTFGPEMGLQDDDFYIVKGSFTFVNHLTDSMYIRNVNRPMGYEVDFPTWIASGDTATVSIVGKFWKHTETIELKSDVFSIDSQPYVWRICRLNYVLIGNNANWNGTDFINTGIATQQLNKALPPQTLTLNKGGIPKSFGMTSPAGNRIGTWKYFDESQSAFVDSIHSRIVGFTVQDGKNYSSDFDLEVTVDSTVYRSERLGNSENEALVYFDVHPAATCLRAFTEEKESVTKLLTPISNEYQFFSVKIFDKSLSWAPFGNSRIYFQDTLHYIVQPEFTANPEISTLHEQEINWIAQKFNVPIQKVNEDHSLFSLNTEALNSYNRNNFLHEMESCQAVRLLSLDYFDEEQNLHFTMDNQFLAVVDAFTSLEQINKSLEGSAFEYSRTLTGSGNLHYISYKRPLRYRLLDDLKEFENYDWVQLIQIDLIGMLNITLDE